MRGGRDNMCGSSCNMRLRDFVKNSRQDCFFFRNEAKDLHTSLTMSKNTAPFFFLFFKVKFSPIQNYSNFISQPPTCPIEMPLQVNGIFNFALMIYTSTLSYWRLVPNKFKSNIRQQRFRN